MAQVGGGESGELLERDGSGARQSLDWTVPMNIIKQQIEIEVCSTCNERLNGYWKNHHFFTCGGCLNEFCKHVGNHLELEVKHYIPTGWPITEDNPRVAGRQSTGSKIVNQYRSTFCEACSERATEVLVRAGLTKTVKEVYCNVSLD